MMRVENAFAIDGWAYRSVVICAANVQVMMRTGKCVLSGRHDVFISRRLHLKIHL